MITEYVDCAELKRLIEEKKLKPAALRYYLRKKGIIFTANNAKEFAEHVYTIFFGATEIEELRDLMVNDGNYEKSMVLKLDVNVSDDEDIIDVLIDEMNKQKSIKSEDYFIEQPIKMDNGAFVQFSFTRKLLGRNKLLEEETRNIKLNIRKLSRTQVLLDIRQQSLFDSKNAVGFIEKLSQTADGIRIKHINLDKLTAKNKVEFFDRIAAHTFKLWQLKTITGITVKRGQVEESEIEEEYVVDEDDTPTLTGISQAVLNGNGLRTNEFVQDSIKNGYYITAMKYRYEHKTETTEFGIVLSFKTQDLRVDIDKTYNEDEGKIYVQPLAKSEQDEIVIEFQNTSSEIFDALLQEQMNSNV